MTGFIAVSLVFVGLCQQFGEGLLDGFSIWRCSFAGTTKSIPLGRSCCWESFDNIVSRLRIGEFRLWGWRVPFYFLFGLAFRLMTNTLSASNDSIA